MYSPLHTLDRVKTNNTNQRLFFVACPLFYKEIQLNVSLQAPSPLYLQPTAPTPLRPPTTTTTSLVEV